ncbi:MAG: V-type ATP synthase subunit F [Candidatus Micrarchaeota archaeon]|nr:V-type ATP synthase subunit F [Candidatus Micrarchaeota archaeon]
MEPLKTYKIVVVGNTQLALGFKLSGVAETYSVKNAVESERVLRELMQRDDIGIIITTSGVLGDIRDRKLSNAVSESALPMVIEVPSYREEGQPDTLRKLIMRAIGIDINKTA